MLFEIMFDEPFYNAVIVNHPDNKATIDERYRSLT
jgi:hypothetical protein